MKPRGESPRRIDDSTLPDPSRASDDGLPSLAEAVFDGNRRKPRRSAVPSQTWSDIIGIPLPALNLADRRIAFGVALRQQLHPFVFNGRHQANLFPDSSGKIDVIRRTATVLDGIGASPEALERLSLPFGITTSALRYDRVHTKSLHGILEDVEGIAENPRDVLQACIRIGSGIETYLSLQPEHFDGETILQRALGAFHRLRTESVTSHIPMPPRA